MAHILKNANDEFIKYDGVEVFMATLENVVKGVDINKRQLSMKGSDETTDRDGDIISVAGWDLNWFLKNPVFLWSHQYSGPESVPLARAIKVVKRRSPSASLDFVMQFPTEGINPFADMILALDQEKIINASSVGFIPREWEPVDGNKDDMDRYYYGPKKFLKQELLELSGCAVPCNPAALQNAVKGFMHPQTPKEKAAQVVQWLMGKAMLDTKEIGVDTVELNGEMQDLKCVVEEEGPTQIQVPEKILPQGVDNTQEKDYNNVHAPTEDKTVPPVTPSEESKGDEMTVKYNYAGIEAVDMKEADVAYFKATKGADEEVTFEPVDPKDFESTPDLEGKIALVFGQNITVVEPKEFIELLGIKEEVVPVVPSTVPPVTDGKGADTETQEELPVDYTKLLDSLKRLSAILPGGK